MYRQRSALPNKVILFPYLTLYSHSFETVTAVQARVNLTKIILITADKTHKELVHRFPVDSSCHIEFLFLDGEVSIRCGHRYDNPKSNGIEVSAARSPNPIGR